MNDDQPENASKQRWCCRAAARVARFRSAYSRRWRNCCRAASPIRSPVISGTSAGAVNSVVLASRAQNFRSAVAELEHVWGHFRCHHVYKTDNLTMLKSSLHWLASIVLGGWLVGTPKSLLDNAPLRAC